MSVIPCEQDAALRTKIVQFAAVLETEAHTLGTHGLDEKEFYNSGLFRGAVERLRGQFSADMHVKREFVQHILNYMQDGEYIRDWESTGGSNRHDYLVNLNSGRVAVIELKGCLDGNNTNIFERPANAHEFVLWSVCTNPGADPRHNVWSGIHTRLSAEIILREQRVDGLIVWDMVCATIGRPCPKVAGAPERLTEIAHYNVPPPCIYVFPATVPSLRTNPAPISQKIGDVELLSAFHNCFRGDDSEINHVDFSLGVSGVETVRTTTIRRGGVTQKMSRPTPLRRS